MSDMPRRVRAVLFDLDGTLIDTAPDMVAALNTLRGEEGRGPLAFAAARCQVSHGSTGLLKLGFPEVDAQVFEQLRTRLLALYRAKLVHESCLFAGCGEVLDTLESRGLKWGIVTNKPGWLAEPLLRDLQLYERAGCIVSGDTLPQRKPHPLPLLHAARLIGVPPEECVYVGDAERDIQAARAAGMPGLLAGFGYLGPDDTPDAWGADAALADPVGLLAWLDARSAPHAVALAAVGQA